MDQRKGCPYGITFAYGSNLDRNRMLDPQRCPQAEEIGVVRLQGYRLEFFGGAADLESEQNSFVPAVAWRINAEDEARLDRREGVLLDPPSYVKKPISAVADDGERIDGYAYVMTAERRIDRPRPPSDDYYRYLSAGYEQHGFVPEPLVAARTRAWSATCSLSLPAYDDAYMDFFGQAVRGFIGEDRLLGSIRTVRDRHLGPIRNVRGDKPLDQPMRTLGATMSLHRDSVRDTDIDAHSSMIGTTAQEMIAEQSKGFFRNLAQICDAAGTTVQNIGGGAPTVEQFRELLQKMDLSFDDDGNLSGQTLYVAPEAAEKAQALIKMVEQDPECQRIVLEKREEWLKTRAARARRTLS